MTGLYQHAAGDTAQRIGTAIAGLLHWHGVNESRHSACVPTWVFGKEFGAHRQTLRRGEEVAGRVQHDSLAGGVSAFGEENRQWACTGLWLSRRTASAMLRSGLAFGLCRVRLPSGGWIHPDRGCIPFLGLFITCRLSIHDCLWCFDEADCCYVLRAPTVPLPPGAPTLLLR